MTFPKRRSIPGIRVKLIFVQRRAKFVCTSRCGACGPYRGGPSRKSVCLFLPAPSLSRVKSSYEMDRNPRNSSSGRRRNVVKPGVGRAWSLFWSTVCYYGFTNQPKTNRRKWTGRSGRWAPSFRAVYASFYEPMATTALLLLYTLTGP